MVSHICTIPCELIKNLHFSNQRYPYTFLQYLPQKILSVRPLKISLDVQTQTEHIGLPESRSTLQNKAQNNF